MSLSGLSSVTTVTVGVLLLASCVSAQQLGTPPILQERAAARIPAPGQSWIDRSAKREALFYVADPSNGLVRVYSLDRRKLVGLLYQDNEPSGMCVDAADDVFVPGLSGGSIYEYPHGVKKPKAQLTPVAMRSMSCAVDPSTGNLAVTTLESDTGTAGNVAIYPNAQGSPTIYNDPALFEYFFCGYDASGNLFVDGLAPSSKGGGFVLAELPKGSTTFTNITLNQAIGQPGQVQWDGTYVAVGDATTTNIYRFAISGSAGTLQGTTALKGATIVNDFWIHGTNVIVANAYAAHSLPYTQALFYRYPAGGKIRAITGSGRYTMEGVAVSLVP